MKTKLTLLLAGALSILTLTPGCVTTPSGQNIIDPVAIETVAQGAAALTATGLLQYNPAYRLELELSRKSLRVAVDAGSTNLADLRDALSHLPVSQLQGTNGTILVTGGVTILDNAQRLIAKI